MGKAVPVIREQGSAHTRVFSALTQTAAHCGLSNQAETERDSKQMSNVNPPSSLSGFYFSHSVFSYS